MSPPNLHDGKIKMSARRDDIDDFDVRYMYEVDGMTQQEIADYYGVSQQCIYWRLHPEKVKENNDKCYLEHPEKKKEYNKQWWREHLEYKKEYSKQWWQTENGKECKRKDNSNRRELGFIPLNDPFSDSEAHHIDTEHVIHIPRELHQSICHNLITGHNMESINAIAFEYITEEMFDELIYKEI